MIIPGFRSNVFGSFERVFGEITRSDNATPYSILDAVASSSPSATTHKIANAARFKGGTGWISGATLYTSLRTWVNPVIVYIYDKEPSAWEADNAAFPGGLYADTDDVVWRANFTALACDVAAGAVAFSMCSLSVDFPRSFHCESGSRDLYWKAFLPSGTPTPAALQKFKLVIHVLQA
jgi:hypothetical protein